VLVVVAPGQGAQKPGFLAGWLELPGAAAALNAASAAAGLDLAGLGLNGSEDAIQDTACAQPLLVAAGLIAGAALAGAGVKPDLVAGHSAGEITAAGLAGALTPDAAAAFAAARGRAMAEASVLAPTGMTAILGGDAAEVAAAIAAAGLEVANFNGPGQIVAAGRLGDLARLPGFLPARTRTRALKVAGAFHTKYMRPALAAVAGAIRAAGLKDPAIPLVSSVDGAVVQTAAGIEDRLAGQIIQPVRWDLVMERLAALGTTGLLELPPAGTLAAIAKRHLPGVELFKLDTPDQLDDARAFALRHQEAA
jgi:[acyl-carrier-protein] S-malonyltransferase